MTAPAHERAPDVPALNEPVITVMRLTKRYGLVTALDEVSCTVTGGITGLLGANGAGKSTLIKILLGLVEPDAGAATVLGHDVVRHGLRARERIGYMPEHDCLPADVSAAEFVAHMAQLSGLPPRQAWIRAADTLRYVGLDEERYRPIGGYSTGMKQRVKFAVALVHDPRLLLLDEPTNGLDPAGREQMLELIQRTGRTQGVAILMATHLLADVERVCDHVLVLDGGRLARAGPLAAFRSAKPLLRVDVGPADAPRLAAALARQGEDVRVQDGEVLVALRDYAAYDRIRDAVAALGLPLLRLTQVSSTLADIFAENAEP